MNAGLTAGNNHVAGCPPLPPNNRQQILAACRAPLVALFGFRQDAEQRHFPIGQLVPGMLGVTPRASYRASLQTNKDGRHAGEVTLALQGLEHLVNRVLHSHLCLG